MTGEELATAVLDGLAAPDPRLRDEWADAVTDGLGAFSVTDARRLAAALVDAALTEHDAACREAQLHALDALVSHYPIDRALLAPVLRTDEAGLGAAEREYLAELRSCYRDEPG